MAGRIPLFIKVNGKASEPEDVEVAGAYLVEVDSDLGERDQVSAALDIFHANMAIACLDDFSISVIDEDGNDREENEEHESYDLRFEKRGEFCGPVDPAELPEPRSASI